MPWDELDEVSVALAKNRHGYVFRIRLDGGYAYFRAITRAEAASLGLMAGILSGEQEDALLKLALVHPDEESLDIDSMSAGLPTTIGGKILSVSGLTGAEELSSRYNEIKSKKTIFHTISSTICAAFPTLDPYELDTFPLLRLLELLMIAEETLMVQSMVSRGEFGEIDFEPIDSSEPLTDEQKDAQLRAMLEGESTRAPAGWIDRTKKAPPGATISNPPDTAL